MQTGRRFKGAGRNGYDRVRQGIAALTPAAGIAQKLRFLFVEQRACRVARKAGVLRVNADRRQRRAILQRVGNDRRHARGDVHRFQRGTGSERPGADARHAGLQHHSVYLVSIIQPGHVFHLSRAPNAQNAGFAQRPPQRFAAAPLVQKCFCPKRKRHRQENYQCRKQNTSTAFAMFHFASPSFFMIM